MSLPQDDPTSRAADETLGPSRTKKTRANRYAARYAGPARSREAHRNVAKRREMAKRRTQAYRLYREQHLTFEQVGQELGVSVYTAYYDIVERERELNEREVRDSAFLLAQQQQHLESVILAHLDRIDEKDSAAVVLQALRDLRQLHGMNRQPETGPSVEQFLTAVRAILRGLFEHFSTPEQKRVILSVVRQQAPTLPAYEPPPQEEQTP